MLSSSSAAASSSSSSPSYVSLSRPPPVPPAPASSSAELEAILAGINRIGSSPPPPVPPPPSASQTSITLMDSMPNAPSTLSAAFSSSAPSSPSLSFPASYPLPPAPTPPNPTVHYASSSQPQSSLPSTHSLLSPSTNFSSSPSSNSAAASTSQLESLNTTDLRRELEALKRRSAAAPAPPPPGPSPTVLRYSEELQKLKVQLSELKRKEAEMLAMQAETQRLAEEERRAAEQRQREVEHYHKLMGETTAPLPISATALSELEAIQAANAQREQKLKAYAAEEMRLRQLKAMAEEQYRLQRAVDVCFVVDCTSSMQMWIQAVKDKVQDTVSAVRRENDCGEVRVAFVGYRDYFDEQRFIAVDFTTDIAAVLSHLHHVTATGGGDIPEDLAGGLHVASTLSWRARTRSVIVIADAPCHGRDFHHFEEDARNASVRDTYDAATELTGLRSLGVDLCFAKITKGTDLMLERFRSIYDRKEEGRVMRVIVLGNSVEAFLPQIVATITDSISRARSWPAAPAPPR